jgi:type IV secretory pathway VirB10-like protein
MRLIALLCFGALSLAAAAEGMYKWVDENGKTHYSDSPPPDDKKATKIDIKPTPPSGPVTQQPDWKQKELDQRTQHIQKEQADKAKSAKDEKEQAERHDRCVEARRRLNILQAGRPVFTVNDKGERIYLEDADRARETEALKDRIDKNCD